VKNVLKLALLLVPAPLVAQTVTITGTVKDAQGNAFVNGSGRVILTPTNVQFTTGITNPVPGSQSPVLISALDAFGHFSVSLTSTAAIDQQPSNPKWLFTFCSAPLANFGNVCFSVGPLALTSNQDISAQIAAAPPPTLPVVSNPASLTGNNAFTGNNTFPKINNVFYVDGVTYPFSTAGLQAAIAAAIAVGGGTVDARGMGSFNITSEIDVGNHAQVPVTLLLPQAATWTVSGITNGTSCAIKQFSQSSILGPGTAGSSAMVIHGGANTNNLDSLYCTEAAPVGNGSYVRAEGFLLYNPNGATMTNGAMNVQATFDDSEFRDVTVASYGTVGLNVHALVCCGTTFTNVTSNANHVANSIPVQIIGGAPGPVAIAFYNLSANHPGPGRNAIVLSAIGNGNGVHFYNTYSEGNNSDNTTANISSGSTAGPIEFYGLTCNDKAGSTAYCLDMPNPGSGQASLHIYGMHQLVGGSANCVNDHYTPKTVACDANGNMSVYVTGNSNMTQLTAGAVLDTGLTVGNCVQATTGGLLTSAGGACGTSSGTLTPTGAPASGNLAKWSGATSLTNADLTGDVTTSGTVATTLAASIPGAKTFSTSLTSPAFISSSANPASSGTLRLASNVDAIEWRNNANNGDVGLSKNTSDVLVYGSATGGIQGHFFQTDSATPALSGTLRLASNVDAIEWRNNANSGDVGISKNASDFFNFGGAGIQTAIFQTTTANVAASGQYRLASADSIGWRNNANNADLLLSKNSSDNLNWPNNIIATAFVSNSANVAATGTLRLASNVDAIEWRNNANSGDVGLSKNTSDFLNFGGAGIQTAVFQTTSANVSASGQHRLASSDTITWRNNANNADLALGHNSSDQLTWPGSFNSGGIVSQFISSSLSSSPASVGTLRLNKTDSIAWRNAANTQDLFLNKDTNDNLTWASQLIPVIVAKADQTAQTANIALATLYTVPAAQGGMYRLSCYVVVTTAAGTSSTMPSCIFQATDVDAGVAVCGAGCQFTVQNSSNTVATTNSANAGAAGANGGTIIINAKASTAIQYGTTGYASNPAATMQYAIHVKLEYLGT